MQVFKAYIIIAKKNLPQMLIYVGIFLFIAVMISSLNKTPPPGEFSQAKTKLAIFNNDINGVVSKALVKFLSDKSEIVTLDNNSEKIQDALFFRNVEYIVKIPVGFSDSLRTQNPIQLEKISVPGSTSSFYTDMLINNFVNTTLRYIKFEPSITDVQLASNIQKDMSINTPVVVKTYETYSGNTQNVVYYFNYLAYSLMAISILGVSGFMIVFGNIDIRRRNLCAPMTSRSMNFQILLGNMIFAAVAYIILVGISFFLYGSDMFTTNAALLCLNAGAFMFAAISLSLLIGNFAKPNSISAITNVITLGTCFISGVFVPQQFLGSAVLTFASFTPTYWYVKTNNEIGTMINFSSENLMRVGGYALIELGFGLLFLIIAFFVSKRKRVSNN